MGENEAALIDQSFVSNIKIVRFVLVHCSFDMNYCECLGSLKLPAVKPVSTIKISICDTKKKIYCHLSLSRCRLTTRGKVGF